MCRFGLTFRGLRTIDKQQLYRLYVLSTRHGQVSTKQSDSENHDREGYEIRSGIHVCFDIKEALTRMHYKYNFSLCEPCLQRPRLRDFGLSKCVTLAFQTNYVEDLISMQKCLIFFRFLQSA